MMIDIYPIQPIPAEAATEIGADDECARPMQMLAGLFIATLVVAVIAAAALIF